jgi:O-antigen/teichoic acid export membrane protein
VPPLPASPRTTTATATQAPLRPSAEADGRGPAPRRLRASVGWNLGLNAFSKSQSLALLVAGSIAGGLAGVGVATTAMGACYLGGAIADFGLSSELGRLSVTHPTQGMVDRSARALALQAPLALVLAPVIFYLTLGHRTGASAALLVATGVLASVLVVATGLTAVLNGLGDFRSPAARLGSARLVSSVAAVVAVAFEPSPATIIGAFAIGEVCGTLATAAAVRRARAALTDQDERAAVVRRTHAWIGAASMFNVLTNQSDTLLVAPILPPSAVGIYGIASLLQNGVATMSLAASTPFSFRVIKTTVAGDSASAHALLRRTLLIVGVLAGALAALTWAVTQVLGDSVAALAALAAGTAPLVLAIYLPSAVPSVLAAVHYAVGIGYARHRRVGLARIKAGLVALVCIPLGAFLGGVVAAAMAAVVRDFTQLAFARGVVADPPAAEELRPREDRRPAIRQGELAPEVSG